MEDYRKVVMLNSFQFRVLRKLRHLTGLPVYYVIEIEEYGKGWYRVVDVTSECAYANWAADMQGTHTHA